MKTNFLVISILSIFFFGCSGTSSSQESPLSQEIQSAAKDSVLVWLKEGSYDAQIMDKYTGGERAEILSQKMMDAISRNQEWYLEFVKTISVGEKMPYHENLGLTREEYDELGEIYENNELISSGEQPITISIKEGLIHIIANGKLEGLSLIKYDINSNKFLYLVEDEFAPAMVLEDTMSVSGYKGAYREWYGMKWRYSEGIPTDKEAEQLTNFEGLSFTDYSVTVGRTADNLKMLSFELNVVEDGTSLTGGKRQLRILFK